MLVLVRLGRRRGPVARMSCAKPFRDRRSHRRQSSNPCGVACHPLLYDHFERRIVRSYRTDRNGQRRRRQCTIPATTPPPQTPAGTAAHNTIFGGNRNRRSPAADADLAPPRSSATSSPATRLRSNAGVVAASGNSALTAAAVSSTLQNWPAFRSHATTADCRPARCPNSRPVPEAAPNHHRHVATRASNPPRAAPCSNPSNLAHQMHANTWQVPSTGILIVRLMLIAEPQRTQNCHRRFAAIRDTSSRDRSPAQCDRSPRDNAACV